MSSTRRVGRWAVPQRLDVVAIMSDTKIDFTHAAMPGGTVEVHMRAIMASCKLVVPPNVRVINADNSGSGVSPANAAQFSFSSKLGSDQVFSPNETSGSRTVRFQDTQAAMFSWDVQVTAYVANGAQPSGSQSSSSSGGGSSGSSSGLTLPLTKVSGVMRFTANPLTRTVTSQLIKLN